MTCKPFVLLTILALGPLTASAMDAPGKPLTLPAKPGNVTFSHNAHDPLGQKIKCEACHNTDPGKGFPQKASVQLQKDPAHAICVECHKKESKGPTKCADCHKKA